MAEVNPFGSYALELLGRRLAPIPAEAGGKKPLVTWKHYETSPPSLDTVRRWSVKFAHANVGTITGPVSGLTVVDVDDPQLASKTWARFGETPVVVRTPRGGYHFYYRFQGEATAARFEECPIDIRGLGGFIVVPPSNNANGEYKFEKGDISLLADLPSIHNSSQLITKRRAHGPSRGERNSWLFGRLRNFAKVAKPTREDELVLYGTELNSDLAEPLPDEEVLTTAHSVWGYLSSGRLLVPGQQGTLVGPDDLELFKDKPDALLLWLRLRLAHRPGSRIVVVLEALAPTLGWSVGRTRGARDALIEKGRLERLTRGGMGKGTPAQYVLVAV